MKMIGCVLLLLLSYFLSFAQSADATPNRKPDDRYKADILVFLGHPDDETAIFSYLAKAALDEKRRIAVIYGTSGSGGGNVVGIERANSLGAIREIEARRALASFGIHNVWFLNGQDTTSQNVLLSLSNWKHGLVLEQAVRIIGLTRPKVILTFIPALVGDHGDHQAAGVLATEAFDMAGDAAAFPSQLAVPRRNFETLLEGLRPWQSKKIYYFTDSFWLDLSGKATEYSNQEVSPSRRVNYERLAAEEASFHVSQEDYKPLAEVLAKGDLQKFLRDFKASLGFPIFPNPVRLMLGKSHVKTGATADIFEGVSSGSIVYVPPRGFQIQKRNGVSVALGGAWAFYRDFWRAHNLDHLAQIVSSRIYITAGATLQVPLLLRNEKNETNEVVLTLSSKLPEGWSESARSSRFIIEAGDIYPVQALIKTPARASADWQETIYAIQINRREVSRANLWVQLRPVALPQ